MVSIRSSARLGSVRMLRDHGNIGISSHHIRVCGVSFGEEESKRWLQQKTNNEAQLTSWKTKQTFSACPSPRHRNKVWLARAQVWERNRNPRLEWNILAREKTENIHMACFFTSSTRSNPIHFLCPSLSCFLFLETIYSVQSIFGTRQRRFCVDLYDNMYTYHEKSVPRSNKKRHQSVCESATDASITSRSSTSVYNELVAGQARRIWVLFWRPPH